MQIIGEKINGTRKQVGQAIADRNTVFIQDLARRQAEAGVNWLDINAGGSPDKEPEALAWLVKTVQEVTNVSLCLDSANPEALSTAIPYVKQLPMVNSVSGERKKLEQVLPLVVKYKCPVIMLAMDDRGIPKTVEERMDIIDLLVKEARSHHLADDLLYIDPLVMAIAVNTESANVALQTMRSIRSKYPGVHIVSGLSNVSFGLPVRSLINRVFITLAIEAGMDTAILDPLDKGLVSTILASELVLGKDRFCLNYTRAFRSGKLEGK